MSDDLLMVAKAEEQRLLRQLEATPLFRRLEAIRALLSAYGDVPAPGADKSVMVAAARTLRPSSRDGGSVTAQVVAIAMEHLRQEQRRAPSQEILRVVQARGVEVRESDQQPWLPQFCHTTTNSITYVEKATACANGNPRRRPRGPRSSPTIFTTWRTWPT